MSQLRNTKVRVPDSRGTGSYSASRGARSRAPPGAYMRGQAQSSSRDGLIRIRVDAGLPKLDFRSSRRFATWNVLTLNGIGYQVGVIRTLRKYGVAVAGLTEARLTGSDQQTVEGSLLVHSGGQNATEGVALVLNPPYDKALVMWHPISPCTLYTPASDIAMDTFRSSWRTHPRKTPVMKIRTISTTSLHRQFGLSPSMTN